MEYNVCKECGAENPEKAIFFAECGIKLNSENEDAIKLVY